MIDSIASLSAGLGPISTGAERQNGLPGSAGLAGPDAGGDADAFGSELASAIDRVDGAAEAADAGLARLASGEEVDLHGTMIALEKADITLRTMVSVRDKAIGAYEAVMNMAI
jgi:flagellar hook-basal body complex protein FliE